MNEQELIARLQRGDESAFEELIRLYEKKVYTLCVRMCGSAEDAEEAAQDTFLALWRGIDRFRQEKLDSNALVLSHMDDIRSRVMGAENPILAGLQFAILGNYLDFSALQGQVSFEKFTQMLDSAQEMRFDMAVFERFRQDLRKGKKLLYLTDNAGEIGFDRIFAEAIAKIHPNLGITFCVRGGPTLNDATREDAAAVGIPFRVIDNGNLVPGTQLDLLSAEAKQAVETADVILAKGMANVETMLGCGYNIYYAFLVKCQRFVNLFGKPLMTPMLVGEQKES